ncbi:MAG: type VI secretion system tip protein VgrG [Polyangiaceae bacterium]|nr:type VI secretion system tip protein VgrG [Polyangiaceae bacterium]
MAGEDYRVLSYSLQEGLFTVGSLACEIVKDDEDAPDPALLVGTEATLTLLRTGEEQSRTYSGMVATAERAPSADDVLHVRLLVVPRLWKLQHRTDCRVFRRKSVVDIVKQVLDEASITNQKWTVSGSYAERDHVTQYRETDLDFVMRLCSEVGIYFWVDQAEGIDTVCFADDPTGVGEVEGTTTLPFLERFGGNSLGDYVMNVSQTMQIRSDKVTLRDYNPEKPKLKLEAQAEGTDSGSHVLEVYAYPGRFLDPSEGKPLAEVLLTAMQAERNVVSGQVGTVTLVPGRRFSIEDHPYAPLNQEYLVVAMEIDGAERRQFAQTGETGEVATYSCRFFALPTKTSAYRPPRLPRTAIIPGLQSAWTTGPGGEDIHTDAAGRVTAQFHWDRLGQRDDESSRWLRTSQLATGGSMLLPRMNWEVAVAFNEGDPDDPYVMARLYNGTTPPPYPLPENKARGSVQTATTPGGGSSNEFRMDDTKNHQEFFVNASKDYSVEVKNNTTENVGNDCQRKVGSNQKLNVTNSANTSIGANQTVSVGGNQDVHVETFMVDQVGGSHSLSISGNRTMMIGGDHKRDVDGDSTLSVDGMMLDAVVGSVTDETLGGFNHTVGAALVEITAGSRSTMVGGSRDETSSAIKVIAAKTGRGVEVAGNLNQKVGGAIINSAKGDKSESAGASYMEVATGAQIIKADNIVFEGETMVSLVMGASTITLLPALVAVAGVSVKLDGATNDMAALIVDN